MTFPLLGHSIWIHLVNTEPVSPDGGRADLLGSPASTAEWIVAAGLLPAEEAQRLDAAALARIHDLRKLLRGAGELLVMGRRPTPQVAKTINAILASNPWVTALQESQGTWVLDQQPLRAGVDGVLMRIAMDFATMLADGDADQLRRCEAQDCVMFFLDTSKNHSRRWCSMETCGNRAKAAAHRDRVRAENRRE